MAKIGIIVGTGLETLDFFEKSKKINKKNKFGMPSSELLCGTIGKNEVVILSRHGADHIITPRNVNNRANIMALKEAGCTHIISTSVCGSLHNGVNRGDIVIPDQFIDFTRFRDITFYDEFTGGEVKHTAMADPFDEKTRNILINALTKMKIRHLKRGTMVTIEGPRFSTQAESKMFRILGGDVVNFTITPEAILANEIGIPYVTISVCTDYDCWKVDENAVSWDSLMDVFKQYSETVEQLLLAAIEAL